MSNGIKIDTIRYPDGDKKFMLTIFLDDKDSDWVEFDKEQLEGLIAMFQERLAEHDVVEEKQND
jgi:hypothetical protein